MHYRTEIFSENSEGSENKMNQILKREVIFVQIQFVSPLSVSSGENEWTDSDVLRDGEGNPFVSGSSLAGAMRAYLEKGKKDICWMGYSGNEGKMSSLFVSDLAFDENVELNVRDGVALDENKTAISQSKYEMEILEAGAKAHFYIELVLRSEDDEEQIHKEMAFIFNGMEAGELRLGCKKTRGFGGFKLLNVARQIYSKDNYLEYRNAYNPETYQNQQNELEDWLSISSGKTKMIHLEVPLKLEGGISIRQYAARKNEPDYVQLTDNGKPVIPGSSFAGAIRHHIEGILRQLESDGHKPPKRISDIMDTSFGYVDEQNAHISNVIFSEAVIEGARPLTMVRTGVSRFESAVKDGALYKERTFVDGHFVLKIDVRKGMYPEDAKWILGLLLLAVKDLQNGFLAVGGQTAIGRGIFSSDGLLRIDGEEGIEDQFIRDILENMYAGGGYKS